jgi:hypothetical protein
LLKTFLIVSFIVQKSLNFFILKFWILSFGESSLFNKRLIQVLTSFDYWNISCHTELLFWTWVLQVLLFGDQSSSIYFRRPWTPIYSPIKIRYPASSCARSMAGCINLYLLNFTFWFPSWKIYFLLIFYCELCPPSLLCSCACLGTYF